MKLEVKTMLENALINVLLYAVSYSFVWQMKRKTKKELAPQIC